MSLKIEYTFKNQSLIEEALTHPSLSKNKSIKSYERLEFLGDNVVNLIVAQELYKKFPEFAEGKLSQIHSNLVRTKTLADIGKKIGIDQAIKLDHGDEALDGRNNPSTLENAVEALMGAIFIDSDFETTRAIALPLWMPYINDDAYILERDAKSSLQEWAQKKYGVLPLYVVKSETGLAHQKEFTISVEIPNTTDSAIGKGTSRKKAETDAASMLIEILNIK
jgi:ribonuclease III